ncbi:malonyl-ACP O-methyltransferase BioC [Acinetobacter nectaris]|nr:malonyl-ACP O-methyltransferase BioC [Acinetobacter nectaris]MCF9027902.1 malonyl-ACP O-methyltransferase BioC [Acinetobacter nectaris]
MVSISKQQVQQRFARAKDSYTQHATAQYEICEYLAALIQSYVGKALPQLFEVGCGSGLLTHRLLDGLNVDRYIVNDIYPEIESFFRNIPHVELCIGDAEMIDFPKENNAIVSSSALQWMHDLPQFFQKVHESLEAQGWFIFSIFGPENLKEIKSLTGQGLAYSSSAYLKQQLIQHGFDVLHVEENKIVLDFLKPLSVLKHLKATGVTANTNGFAWTKNTLKKFDSDYTEQFSYSRADDLKHYPLTYHPIYIVARRV